MFAPLAKPVPVPDLKDLYNVDSKKAMSELKTDKDITFQGLHAIALPPFAAEAFRSVPSGDPTAILINLLAAAAEFDENKDEDTADASESVDGIIQWLFGAYSGKVLAASYQIVTSQAILTKTDAIHEKCIAQIKPASEPVSTEDDARRTRIATESLLEKYEVTQLASNQQGKKKTWTDRLSKLSQTMILTASKTDYDTELVEPCDEFKEILEQSNVADACSLLQHKIEIILNRSNALIPPGIASALFTGSILWDDGTMPSNFSAFFVPKQKGGLSYNSKEQIALSLKIREGRSGLDEKDLERLVKASIFLPESIYDLQHHVCHIGAIWGHSPSECGDGHPILGCRLYRQSLISLSHLMLDVTHIQYYRRASRRRVGPARRHGTGTQ